MNNVYETNYKYNLFFTIGIVCILVSVLVVSIGGFGNLSSKIFIMLALLIFYFFWITPRKIVIGTRDVTFETLFKKRKIEYANIKKISISYSTKSLIWHSGDKRKADMLCFVLLTSFPLDIIIINDSVIKYHDLCDSLKLKIKH